MATVDPMPEGYPRVTPYLHVDGASAAIDFYALVLGATERMRMPGDAPDKALAARARAIQEPTDEFYGDRAGQFEDPFGHRWSLAAHIEDVSDEEMQRRMAESIGG